MKYLVVVTRDLSYSESAEAIAISSVSSAPEDAEYSRLIGDPRSLAEEA